jgi:hypothetical protein
MDKQELFDYLSENLSLEIVDNRGDDYGRSYQEVLFYLKLINPATGKDEIISSDRFSVDRSQ